MKARIAGLAVVLTLVALGPARAAEPGAYITEIQRTGPGEGEGKPAGERDWRAGGALLALRRGAQVRAQGAARAVVLFHGGGTKAVTPEGPPLTIEAPAASGGGAGQLRAPPGGG